MEFKSKEEQYFYYYCLELKETGFIKNVFYEKATFNLCAPYSRSYLQKTARGVKEMSESLLEKSSLTADFTIEWAEQAKNIFYLDSSTPISCKVKDIPFRLCSPDVLISHIETKAVHEFGTSSSISFPYKQKQVLKDYSIYIQKIKPFSAKGEKCLFEKTFTPKMVIAEEVYQVNTKQGKKGESKLRYEVKTLEEFLTHFAFSYRPELFDKNLKKYIKIFDGLKDPKELL